MNGNHVRPKLKIRNRILAIFVAFLLLSLMIPHAVFATESTDANSNDVAKEVNNEAADNAVAANEGEPAANAVTITGVVNAGDSLPVVGAKISAFAGKTRVSDTATSTDGGTYSLSLYESVAVGTPILLMTSHTDYAFEVIATTAESKEINVNLDGKAGVDIKPYSETVAGHNQLLIDTVVAGQSSHQEVGSSQTFNYNFPVGGYFQMTNKAQLLFHYTNGFDQPVSVTVTGEPANSWYRPYFWAFQKGEETPQYMKVDTDYTLEESTYTVALVYSKQAAVNFTSEDANHDAFHFTFVKNGVMQHELTQAEFKTTTFENAVVSMNDDGSLNMHFDGSDPTNTYVVDSIIKPIAKTGYKVSGWTMNGETFKKGDTVTAVFQETYDFKVTYEVDASQAPQTGDMNFVWIIALSGIALASAVGLRRFKRN